MFFRREKVKIKSLEERLSDARSQGFAVESADGGYLVTRKGCGAIVAASAEQVAAIESTGIVYHGKLAKMVHGGYQMFFVDANGYKHPALAEHLKAVHAFREDLAEALGLTSYYNTSLGSTTAGHLYDRVKDRDAGSPSRPWETK